MPEYKYVQVADTVRSRIRDGTYPPGEYLPPRSQLRAEFQVSDIVINDAMRILRGQGLVATKVGRGTYVVDEAPAAG
jgi:GntR family transcriptional regulator